ncbi:hypothetical protein BDN72DRAFT_252423 [Pluteus cervinus]|uniref:Uncharacterized protein n=1 Tax=Pluteus cervinus TaxID=181527 RepID=A0ACD3AGH4_9AGAR|nr:hypothetical protein BDN72DRAFT_252423 [Pluteus cervinus]
MCLDLGPRWQRHWRLREGGRERRRRHGFRTLLLCSSKPNSAPLYASSLALQGWRRPERSALSTPSTKASHFYNHYQIERWGYGGVDGSRQPSVRNVLLCGYVIASGRIRLQGMGSS